MKKRRFVVKPFSPTPTLAPRAATDLWSLLRNALDKIFRHEMANLSFADLYGYAYKLVVDKQGETMYMGIYNALVGHFTTKRVAVAASSDSEFLSRLNDVWLDSLKILHAVRARA